MNKGSTNSHYTEREQKDRDIKWLVEENSVKHQELKANG